MKEICQEEISAVIPTTITFPQHTQLQGDVLAIQPGKGHHSLQGQDLRLSQEVEEAGPTTALIENLLLMSQHMVFEFCKH